MSERLLSSDNLTPTLVLGAPPVLYAEAMTIFVRTSFVGFHAYPSAPDEVEYLRSRHRHVFNVEAKITVTHDDREVEYHMFLNWLNGVIEKGEKNNQSCEMMARTLLNAIKDKYPDRAFYSVEVNEDGENGSILSHTRVYG